MIQGDMKARATSCRRRAARRRLRRRSAARARSEAASCRSATVAISVPLSQLQLLADLLVELVQAGLEIGDLAGLPLMGQGLEQVEVGDADRGDRLEGGLLVGEDVEERLEVRIGLELLVLERLDRAGHVLEAVGQVGQ